MNAEETRLVHDLLTTQRQLALGVLVDGAPWVGLVPFALAPDGGAAWVHVSRLARHTAGLAAGAPCSALLHGPDAPGGDPLQVPRLTLSAVADPLDPAAQAAEHAAARAAYLARFPGSAPTFALPDFRLVALRLAGGRLVAGFARARDLSPGDLSAAARALPARGA